MKIKTVNIDTKLNLPEREGKKIQSRKMTTVRQYWYFTGRWIYLYLYKYAYDKYVNIYTGYLLVDATYI